MSVEDSANLPSQPQQQPSGGHQPPQGRERFWDLKASHSVEVFLTIVLIVFAGLQYCVYTRQAGIMMTQAEIMRSQTKVMQQQTDISQAEHRPWISGYPLVLGNDSMFHDDTGFNMTLIFP